MDSRAAPSERLLLRERLLEGAVRAAVPLARLAAPLSPKLGRGVAGRTGLAVRLAAWAAAERDPARPLVWVHAPSLGEGLMAQAIIEALRQARPDAQVLFTHFSPSAERLRGQVGADAFDYLPWDARAYLRPVLESVRPGVLALVRTDLWPVLTAEAVRAGAHVALVNAVLSAGSGRTRP
ncbi:MAG TPA: glycosyltransferase N-terminal domain-containing protein, partial [Longimicrobiales bacterium]|nr:glycosyltransferase N-terminal domain-containing protein [Longimicrobiales bacterium]